ncbi:xyloglucanase 113, partial [Perilla frutescens var. hirtella]
ILRRTFRKSNHNLRGVVFHQVNVMLKEFPEEKLGPGINFREYYFLNNAHIPQQVKDSWLDVHLCQAGLPGCGVSNSTNLAGILKFPKRSTEEVQLH